MKRLAAVLAIAACGERQLVGGHERFPHIDCKQTAGAMMNAVFTWKAPPLGGAYSAWPHDVMAMLYKHCTEIRWSMEIHKCLREVTDEASMARCAEKLTKDQKVQLDHVMGAIYAKFDDGKGSK